MALSNHRPGNVINTLGSLIHNPCFTEFLKEKGIHEINSLKDAKAKKLVIRSHGISRDLEEKIRQKDIKIIDTTCPFVKRVQKLATQFEKEGYIVLILGEKTHPEVIGIKSYAKKPIIIKGIKDIPKFKAQEKVALISQTTKNLKHFQAIAEYLKKKFKDAKIINTICDATEKRQKAARQLASQVDIMVVIGGKSSSNTTRLKEVCEKITKTYHIESEKELKRNWFKFIDMVGVTAGASTPDFSINAVLKRIKSYD